MCTSAASERGSKRVNMSDQTASFKVTLYSGDTDAKEVRRFVLPKSTLTSFSILRDKMQVVFQSVKNQPFEVSWEDDEGDQVLISSDEELMIAMKEMGGDVYRLKIHTTQPRLADLNVFASSGPVHSSVWCDVCSEEIKGFRYKCIQCPNYDLCSQCERSQHHKEHFMIRIPDPISWKPEFGHRLAHFMSKSARKHRGASHCGDGRGKGNAHHHHHSCHYHELGNGGQRYQIPQFVQQIFRNMWDPTGAQAGQQAEAAATSARTDNNTSGQEDGRVTYLKTIGETVASLLDPLGIDVDIEVETNRDKDAKSQVKEDSDGKKVNKNDEKPGENLNEAAECSPKPETQIGCSNDTSPKLEKNSSKKERGESDSDEWTVINKDALPTSDKVQEEKESSSGSESKPTEHNYGCSQKMTNTGESVPVIYPLKYPTLNPNYEEPRNRNPVHHHPVPHNVPILYPMQAYPGHNVAVHHPPPIPAPFLPPMPAPGQMAGSVYPHQSPTHQINHPRPRINQALVLMTSMGFNDEGGWLTTLLEAVNGDVSKALDILQPVKK